MTLLGSDGYGKGRQLLFNIDSQANQKDHLRTIQVMPGDSR